MRHILAALFCLAALPAAAAPEWQGKTAAFFGITFIDTSTEGDIRGVREDETARLAMATEYLEEMLEEAGLTLLDLAPVEEELARTRNPAKCNGCDIRMGQRLGADYVIVSEVQKVSNLILAVNIYVKDAESGRQLRGQAVDIRGNTDESWQRGIRYIMRNNILAD